MSDDKSIQILSKQKEEELANQLKQNCGENGQEINPNKSVPIFLELAQIYQQKSPDFFSLIRSAALYNAAIIRSSSNNAVKIESHLELLCAHVLKLAKAAKNNISLIKIAKGVKPKIIAFRQHVDQVIAQIKQIDDNLSEENLRLKENEKIETLEKLQNNITKKYTKIMADIAQQCKEVLGEAPCRFALVGMGSLARNEITPYSDFENVIVLEEKTENYKSFLTYFQWFSTIFHITIINLQETILPSVAIISLKFYDGFTTRGISLDGMMPHACKFPLGRQEFTRLKKWKTELIKPVSEMLKYLTTDEALKNGYHLSDILTKVCFVYGDKNFFNDFQEKMYCLLQNQDIETKIEDLKSQLIVDLKNFAIRTSLLNIKTNETINIKQTFYRSTTLFISALGKFFNTRASSSFDIIVELDENEFSELVKHKLKYAVALACEVRLRWYMKCKRQNDVIKYEDTNQSSIQCLQELVGRPSLISYFQIAYALQCDISHRFNLKRLHFYSNPNELNISLYYCFGDLKKLRWYLKNLTFRKEEQNKKLCTFEETIRIIESKTNKKRDDYSHSQSITQTLVSLARDFRKQGDRYSKLRIHDDALECFTRYFEILKQIDDSKSAKLSSFMYDLITNPNLSIESREKDLMLLSTQKELEIKKLDYLNNKEFTSTMLNAAFNIVYLDKHKFALNVLNGILFCFEKISFLSVSDFDLAICYGKIGRCFLELNQLKDAMDRLLRSWKIYQKTSPNIDVDAEASITLSYIGRCLMKENQPEKALSYLQKSLDIRIKASVDINSDRGVAHGLSCVGQCFMALNQPFEAMKKFEAAFEIRKTHSRDAQHDNRVAISLREVGCCLMKMNRFEEALVYLQDSLKIWNEISLDTNSDVNVANTEETIADCQKSLICFKE